MAFKSLEKLKGKSPGKFFKSNVSRRIALSVTSKSKYKNT